MRCLVAQRPRRLRRLAGQRLRSAGQHLKLLLLLALPQLHQLLQLLPLLLLRVWLENKLVCGVGRRPT